MFSAYQGLASTLWIGSLGYWDEGSISDVLQAFASLSYYYQDRDKVEQGLLSLTVSLLLLSGLYCVNSLCCRAEIARCATARCDINSTF
jgi:hypothetical protein